MVKRLTALLLICCLLFATAPVFAGAVDGQQVTANAVTVTAGNTTTLTLTAENFNNVAALDVYVYYDAQVFTVSRTNNGSILSGAQASVNTAEAGTIKLSTMALSGINGSGTLLTITFSTKSDCTPGTYPITVAIGRAYDGNLNPTTINGVNGSITVNKPVETETFSIYNYSDKSSLQKGDTLSYQVASASSSRAFVSGEFLVEYDHEVFAFDSVVMESALTGEGAVYSVNSSVLGKVRIAYASVDPVKSFYLFTVKLTVIADKTGTTTLKAQAANMYRENLTMYLPGSTSKNITLQKLPETVDHPNAFFKTDKLIVGKQSHSLFCLEAGAGVAAADFTLTYDPAVLRCVNVTAADGLAEKGGMVVVNPKFASGIIRFSYVNMDAYCAEDLPLVQITWEPIQSPQSHHTITSTAVGVVDAQQNAVALEYVENTDCIYIATLLLEPTCKTEGLATYRCACGTTFQEVIPTLDEADCTHYTVSFVDDDNTKISVEEYHLGETITIPGNPAKAADNTYTYTFAGWDQQINTICDGNATYTATYKPSYIDYTVVFQNWDGTVISSKTYHWGDQVTVPANPTRAADSTYIYTFAGWDQAVVNCAGNVTYTATYTAVSKIPTNAVARIGDDYFTNMDAAIAAAIANGGEIVILKAQTTANALTISGNVTIDFGGLAYTASKIPTGMTYAPIITITEGATVTLKNGTVQVRAANNTLFNYVIENHGTLITENLAIKGQNTYAPNTETATIKNYGTLTLGEGTTILYKVNALLSTTDTVTKVASLELAAPAGFHWADNADLQFHTFDQEVAAKVYRKKAATTTATGVYYKSCTCGESSQGTASEATFTFGDLVPAKAVARVGENSYYNTLQAAVTAAVKTGEEVELVKASAETAFVIKGNVTIDFAGFTFTGSNPCNGQEVSPVLQIAEGATVTLKNGTVQAKYAVKAKFNYLVENNGTLYTENITLKGNNVAAATGNATIMNNGTLSIGEGTVINLSQEGAGFSLKTTNLNVTKVRSATVTAVDGYHWVSGQTLTAHVYDKESIQIQHRKSAPNMNSPAIYYTSCSCGENSKGTAYEATFLYGEKGSNALAEAEIDGYYYRYFDDALAAALENGSTVKLLKDLVTAKPLILNSDVTIDFNGCTYTVNQPTTGVHGYAVAVTIGENAKVNFIGGRLQIRYNRRHLFNYLIENNGTLTTENIVLRGQNVYEPGPSSDTAAILNTGSVTLNAGTVVEIRVNAVNTTNANVTKDANIVLKEAKGYHWSDDQTQLMPHVFDQEIVDINYRKSAATINSPAIFYKTCSCGVNAKGLDENATFEYGNRLGGAAAKVGNTYYASLEEAIAAAIESGETVEVQMAIKNAKALVISGDVTIDFGGYLYTVNTAISDEIGAVITIANGAKVTLKNGTVQVASAVGGKFNALIENNGELYVENIALKGANISTAGAVLVKGNAMTEGEGVTKVDPAK